ncbi:MAG: energy-coupling factor ABC transporter ATP-binding protein [Candidatus Njordarchaeota archaeon]
MLRVNDVWYRYRKGKWILRGISFDIKEGLHCIVGRNGSGKTTLIRIIIGALRPSKGEVIVCGKKIRKIKDAVNLVSYVPSNPTNFLVGPTVREDLEKSSRGEFFDSSPVKKLLNKRVSDLSEGEKRIVAVYSSILQKKKVLILDEPSVGLDKRNRGLIMGILRQISEDRVVLIATNDMRIAYECDNIMVLDNGKIVLSGQPLEVILSDRFIFESPIARFVKLLNIEQIGKMKIRTKKELIDILRNKIC